MQMTDSPELAHGATGGVRTVLRVEGALVLLACAVAYGGTGESWWWFAGAFFAPDLALVAFLGGASHGARAYNATHSYIAPLLLVVVAMISGDTGGLLPTAMVWGAHIGFDRALGYGLKYETAFAHTHLGRIGRIGRSAPLAQDGGH